ncbi:capsid protein [Calfel virus LSF45_cir359]|uniref:Capsid protein n=1 Tax=Calfel virus LSF45_cir359 TaxID=2951261 RepID=A0AAX3BQF0_9CIRC|nr:capsid protein [Calfel virus LSF45_cir359]UUG66208.1 capsid protein [Calfel virus LSF45_cir359]
MYFRRRHRLFRRRKRTTRRRRFRPRRRLWIRRPTAGSYFVQKLQTIAPLNITYSGTSNTFKSILVTFPLNSFITTTFFDFYRILKAKWAIKPATPVTNWVYWGYGVSVIDLDDTAYESQPTHVPWANNSTRKQFVPYRRHSRYFTPKPKTSASGNQSSFFPASNRQWWWNASQTGVDWLGIKACFYNGRPSSSQNYELIETKTIWVKWRQHI